MIKISKIYTKQASRALIPMKNIIRLLFILPVNYLFYFKARSSYTCVQSRAFKKLI